MSVQADVAEFLRRFEPDSTGYIPLTPKEVAAQTGYSADKVNKTLFNLMIHGKIELVRGPNGRTILGYRNTDAPVDGRKARGHGATSRRERLSEPVTIHPGQAKPARGSVPTPHLDEYERQKKRFQSLVDELGPLVRAEFEQNTYAEEGLLMKARLASIEFDYSRIRRENEEMDRDLRTLRGRRHSDMTAAALRDGSMVTHSSD